MWLQPQRITIAPRPVLYTVSDGPYSHAESTHETNGAERTSIQVKLDAADLKRENSLVQFLTRRGRSVRSHTALTTIV